MGFDKCMWVFVIKIIIKEINWLLIHVQKIMIVLGKKYWKEMIYHNGLSGFGHRILSIKEDTFLFKKF